MPATSAASVFGRIGTHSSARVTAVSDCRGSMTIVRTCDACLARVVTNSSPPPLIRVSCGLLPNSTTSRELTRSSNELPETHSP